MLTLKLRTVSNKKKRKKEKKRNCQGKMYMVLLYFLNISTPVVKDDYPPRKLLKNKKEEKMALLYMIYLYDMY